MKQLTKRQVIEAICSPLYILSENNNEEHIVLRNKARIECYSLHHDCGAVDRKAILELPNGKRFTIFESSMDGCHQHNHQRPEYIISKPILKLVRDKIESVKFEHRRLNKLNRKRAEVLA